ncbi:hypothetical protein QE390_001452 [Siphonobacter sp. SORGH_AS 1065]|nr:hypothetical protein [Siphonobacter sp. SORGH_AS_1065]
MSSILYPDAMNRVSLPWLVSSPAITKGVVVGKDTNQGGE